MNDQTAMTDQLVARAGYGRTPADGFTIAGWGSWLLINPDGALKTTGMFTNIITQVGDQYLGERATGIATPPAQVTGMKLGTGTTAVAKTGAGAALVTYLTNSHQAIDGTYPQSALSGTIRRITWRTTWAAGKATGNSISEAVIINDTLADATSTAANTIARALLSPTVNKAAGDSLELTWHFDVGTA